MTSMKQGRGSVLPALTNRWMKANDVETDLLVMKKNAVLDPFQPDFESDRKTQVPFHTTQDLEEDPRGISRELMDQNRSLSNYKNHTELKEGDHYRVDFTLSDDQPILVDSHQFDLPEGHRATAIISTASQGEGAYYRNGAVRIQLKEDALLHLIVLDQVDEGVSSNLSLIADMEDGAELKVTTVCLGSGKSNFYLWGDLVGYESKADIHTAYLGWGQARMDFFYNVAFFNHFTDGHIEANGALLDRAYKSFRDTLDFKEGSVGAIGGEEEFTLLLSEEANSLAVPILLCHEDLVQANHAASNGKLDEDILFYLMSRGFPRSEAEGLIVESRMRPSLDRIPDEDLRENLKKVIHERIVNRHGK